MVPFLVEILVGVWCNKGHLNLHHTQSWTCLYPIPHTLYNVILYTIRIQNVHVNVITFTVYAKSRKIHKSRAFTITGLLQGW